MLKDITIGQHFPGDTIIHRLDPRIKILVVMMFITSLFFVDKFYPYIFVVGFILATIVLSKVPVIFILKG